VTWPPTEFRPANPHALSSPIAHQLLAAARELSQALALLRFGSPIAHVYDPLQYAWAPYESYVTRYGNSRKRVVLLGMNPGPFGMMQTGVPFGEVAAVRDWMGLLAPVERPDREHPRRPIEGFGCPRSEVSGRRLWGWAALRFGAAPAFFRDWFVLNYCPLVFLEASGRNFTPDKLPAAQRKAVAQACDRHLAAALTALQPEWAIGVGAFAERSLRSVLEGDRVDSTLARRMKVAQILHPSPASPAANRGWSDAVDRRLAQLGVPLGAAEGAAVPSTRLEGFVDRPLPDS
jgi:single-strand selective monofunctional uracil DNA glycosylase